jgi:hypothetical protein
MFLDAALHFIEGTLFAVHLFADLRRDQDVPQRHDTKAVTASLFHHVREPGAEPAARNYIRVSTDDKDLARQTRLKEETQAAGFYVAGVYAEKASGARADRRELLRLIEDL